MTASLAQSEFNSGWMRFDIVGAASTAAAGLGSILNPVGVPLLITDAILQTLTASTGAANLSIGITTAAATATDVFNAGAVNGLSANHCYNCFVKENGAKTAISSGVPAVWTATTYLTFTGSATTAGYTGTLWLKVLRLS